jgi:hypothetical protein
MPGPLAPVCPKREGKGRSVGRGPLLASYGVDLGGDIVRASSSPSDRQD